MPASWEQRRRAQRRLSDSWIEVGAPSDLYWRRQAYPDTHPSYSSLTGLSRPSRPPRMRPRTIHIYAYPPGFVPRDLLPTRVDKKNWNHTTRSSKKKQKADGKQKKKAAREKSRNQGTRTNTRVPARGGAGQESSIRPRLGRILASLSVSSALGTPQGQETTGRVNQPDAAGEDDYDTRPSSDGARPLPQQEPTRQQRYDQLLAEEAEAALQDNIETATTTDNDDDNNNNNNNNSDTDNEANGANGTSNADVGSSGTNNECNGGGASADRSRTGIAHALLVYDVIRRWQGQNQHRGAPKQECPAAQPLPPHIRSLDPPIPPLSRCCSSSSCDSLQGTLRISQRSSTSSTSDASTGTSATAFSFATGPTASTTTTPGSSGSTSAVISAGPSQCPPATAATAVQRCCSGRQSQTDPHANAHQRHLEPDPTQTVHRPPYQLRRRQRFHSLRDTQERTHRPALPTSQSQPLHQQQQHRQQSDSLHRRQPPPQTQHHYPALESHRDRPQLHPQVSPSPLSSHPRLPVTRNAANMAGRLGTLPPSSYALAGSAYGPAYGRNGIMAVRSAKSAASSLVTEVPKPVASGSGVTCSVLLAEPNVFLSGFDHHNENHSQRDAHTGTALLRGKLQLVVTKNVKIKAVTLKLLGRARTEWPEGIPPLKQDIHEEHALRTQVLTFFNAMNDGWETDYGNQCSYKLKGDESTNSSSTNLALRPSLAPPLSSSSRGNLTARDLKRLSLQNVQSRSFNKNEASAVASPIQAKGFKVFYPGTYEYSFELPIDHHQLETIKLQYGSVKWELHATVDRSGAFKPNLHGVKEVSIVRLPDQLSLEMTEPISISRQWEDQLHYDIMISGKSFPIGSKIPIAFKLTPLAKVQVHKLKVFVTESIEYWTNDKRVTRKDPGRKILLLEKSAGKPLDPAWASSEMRTVRGGELSAEERETARGIASRRRNTDAARRQTEPAPLPEPAENLLGDLELGLETYWGSTEIEANVQIPTCEMMARSKDLRLHPDCSWKNVNVYHWIKIVMRISRLDPEDPTGTKRRHFEISIDSPFTVLNCRATQANTNLPAYSGSNHHGPSCQATCGCPDAASIVTETSPNSSTGTLPGVDMSNENMPAPPQAAHLHATAMNPASATQAPPLMDMNPRPIHLMRVPSFNPPAFDDDIAPPPAPELVTENPDIVVTTPPPHYDIVVGTPSVDGMADYFARLADYGYDEPDDDSSSDSDASPPRILERSGRVNVAHPRTPGGRMPSRSMEIRRPPVILDMSAVPVRNGSTASAAV